MSPEDRMIQRRLAWFRHVEEVTRNVAKTCRYYGSSRTRYYVWYRRYAELGPEGLRDRSRRPHSHPRTTRGEAWEKVLYLRRHYHFGPARIQMYLQRYHGIAVSKTGIWRLLKRTGVNRLPSNMRYRRREDRFRRYEKPLPGHQLQIDVKFLEPLPERRRYYQYTAIDDCTRLRVLKIYERNTWRNSTNGSKSGSGFPTTTVPTVR